MTATITHLETNLLTLRRAYMDSCDAFNAHPTLARMDTRMMAYKAWFVRTNGAKWRDGIDAAMERERRACVAVLDRAQRRGGRHG